MEKWLKLYILNQLFSHKCTWNIGIEEKVIINTNYPWDNTVQTLITTIAILKYCNNSLYLNTGTLLIFLLK